MVKRFLSLGAAIALILSLSVTSFAVVYDYGFPYFSRVRLRQGSTDLIPITTWDTNNPIFLGSYSKSFSNSSSGNIQFYLYGNAYGDYTCKNINGGMYAISGYLDFASTVDISGVSLGRPNLYISTSDNVAVEDYSVASYDYSVIEAYGGGDINRVHYSFVFNVGSTVTNYSSMRFDIPVSGNAPCIGWSVYTGANNIVWSNLNLSVDESVDYAHDSNFFSRIINSIVSGVGRIVDAVKDDSDAQQAAEIADQQSVDDGQSQIAAVESFEESTSQSISSGVSTINNSGYLVVPDYSSSASGMGAALAAISWIFAGVFNRLGSYQVVVTVPLVLGIMLILVGRGTLALGRVISANARAARREKGSGGNA